MDFDLLISDNHIEDDISEINEVNEENENNEINDNKITNQKDRYLIMINLLGLNENIKYPLKMICDTIIELHAHVDKNYNKYVRCIKFSEDNFSQKIKETLDIYGDFFSYRVLLRKVKNLHRHFLYNTITNHSKLQKTNFENQQNLIVGFNYTYPCWKPLNTLNIKYII